MMPAPERRRVERWGGILELAALGAVCAFLAAVVALVVLWAPIAAVH